MDLAKISVLALALCAVSATAGIANESDTQASCLAAQSKVSAALANAQNADAARRESRLGLEACNAGFYHQGMVYYGHAMELLGVKG
ncbi:MAG: hypothetical protein JO261_14175 [Alphaproteobacteria bacterium]|nr:hypothetical protein [Alphaproteobacteria bacterium]MBV9694841.1 hypothetical protein [Alphaproteobacteria bacterium]